MLSDEWLSRYGLLENFNASVTRTGTGTGTHTGTWTTGVTAIALFTSCSRAKNDVSPNQNKVWAKDTYLFKPKIWSNFIFMFCVKKKKQLNRHMGKPTICIVENKGADQLHGNCEADQRLCFRYSDSTIPPILNSKVSSF